MKQWMAASVLTVVSALGSVSAWAALQTGDTAPDFKLNASLNGKAFPYDLKVQRAKGPVVVYFYPSAYTGGCNIQARAFAERAEQFAAAGATVVGVSQDSIERLNRFSADPEYCAGKVAVASDAKGVVSNAFALKVSERPGRKDTRGDDIDHATVERTTFIIAPDGKVAATVEGLPPLSNVEKSLEWVRSLNPSTHVSR